MEENKSMMKENYPPQRQGQGFRINLGLNSGPFLAKDIAQTNPQSIGLLAAKQILQSQESTSSLLKSLEKHQEKQWSQLKTCNISNVMAELEYMRNEVHEAGKNMKKVNQERMKVKKEMKETMEKIEGENERLMETTMPYLRKLGKVIRESHQIQKSVNEENKRELEGLAEFRSRFLDGIITCESKIIQMQEVLGIKTTDPS